MTGPMASRYPGIVRQIRRQSGAVIVHAAQKPKLHWYEKSNMVASDEYGRRWEPIPVCGIWTDFIPRFAREKKQVTCKNCKKKLRVLHR